MEKGEERELIRLFSLATLSIVSFIHGASAQLRDGTIPYSLRASATNDPKTNPTLKIFSQLEKNADERLYADVTIIRSIMTVCQPVVMDEKIKIQLEKNYHNLIAGKSKLELADLYHSFRVRVSNFDFSHAVQLCAGYKYLYGKNGVRIKNFIKSVGDWRKNQKTIQNIDAYFIMPEWKQ